MATYLLTKMPMTYGSFATDLRTIDKTEPYELRQKHLSYHWYLEACSALLVRDYDYSGLSC